MNPLHGAKVGLGVSGGIAAYKAADLASKLVQQGADVETVLTTGAAAFIQPLTFQALTHNVVHVDVFEPWSRSASGHVSLAAALDILLIAPASANTIARLSLGMADDFLGVLALASVAPMLIAPAMEHHMFHHPATQSHLETLRQRGATIVGPESGRLASGEMGDGRLAPVDQLVGAARQLLGRTGPLAGRHVVVTAGGTREPLDPVRFLGNGSSGTMGYALAQAVIDSGGKITLISAPSNLSPPYGATVVKVQTAVEMQAAVATAIEGADAIIMSAAVADFRAATVSSSKIKKNLAGDASTIHLTRNPDILAALDEPHLIKVGFAAETEDLVENAIAKLQDKKLAMIVANDAAATIGSSRGQATIIHRHRPPEPLPSLDKAELASIIIERLCDEFRTDVS